MRYRLRTLLILLAVGPPVIAFLWLFGPLLSIVFAGIATTSGWLSLVSSAPVLGLAGAWTGLALYVACSRPTTR